MVGNPTVRSVTVKYCTTRVNPASQRVFLAEDGWVTPELAEAALWSKPETARKYAVDEESKLGTRWEVKRVVVTEERELHGGVMNV